MASASACTRAVLVIAASAVGAAACGRRAVDSGPALVAGQPATIDRLVGAAAASGIWLVLGWVAVAVGVTAASALPGAVGGASARMAAAVTPRLLRRLVVLAIGMTVAGGATPAFASTSHRAAGEPAAVAAAWARPATLLTRATTSAGGAEESPAHRTADVERRSVIAEGTLQASTGVRDGSTEADRAGPSPFASEDGGDWPLLDRPSSPETVVVEPGDCLWTIARDHLAPDVTPAQVAAEWPRWYEANRAVIGADPDVIHPGQRLAAPPPAERPR